MDQQFALQWTQEHVSISSFDVESIGFTYHSSSLDLEIRRRPHAGDNLGRVGWRGVRPATGYCEWWENGPAIVQEGYDQLDVLAIAVCVE